DVSWRPAYRAVVDELVAKHGGRYVARTTCPWEVLEGVAPDTTNITMIEFPSMEHARAWYNDPEYAPNGRLAIGHGHARSSAIEGAPDGERPYRSVASPAALLWVSRYLSTAAVSS